MLRICLLLLTFLFIPSFATAEDEEVPTRLENKEILHHLEQLLVWRQKALSSGGINPNARDTVLQETLTLQSNKIIRYGFQFARQQAEFADKNVVIFEVTNKDKETADKVNTALLATKKTISDLQKELGKAKNPIQRERINGQLKVANAQLELQKSVIGLFSDTESDEGSFTDKINNLVRTVPEVQLDNKKPETDSQQKKEEISNSETNQAEAPSENGLYGLFTSIFKSSRREKEVDGFMEQTEKLHKQNQELLGKIRQVLNATVQQANLAAQQTGTSANKTVAAQRQQVDSLVGYFKNLSESAMLLVRINRWLEASQQSLQDWKDSQDTEFSSNLSQLFVRLGFLFLTLMIPLVLANIAQRAIRRYVKDDRRRRQLKNIKRILVALSIVFIIMLNFVTELGSFATFMGFMMAGLAVALQTVLLSLIAHFFFFGKYGVRAGDKISISGVTGEVMHVGMMRLYMQEMKEDEEGHKTTGRIVVFPNSILFQPAAFYKHKKEV